MTKVFDPHRPKESHGLADAPIYNVWLSMRGRCYRPSDTNYRFYGAQGIRVCEEWFDSFNTFHSWALSCGYEYGRGLSIERIDPAGDYQPGNCRWATRSEQARNKKSTHRVTAFGQTKSLADWAEDDRCSVTYNAVLYRLRKGWEPERAITTPRTQKGGPP